MKNTLLLLTLITLVFTSCSKESSQSEDIATAMSKINGHFQENLPGHAVILIGKDETLISDLGQDVIDDFNSQVYVDSFGGPSHPNNLRHTEIITHYEEGTPAFIALPAEIQEAVNVINDLKITGKLKDSVAVEHVIGTATHLDMKILVLHGYGVPLEITPGAVPTYMFMSNKCWEGWLTLLGSISAGGALFPAFASVSVACIALSVWEGPFAFATATACEIGMMTAAIAGFGVTVIDSYSGGVEVEADC